MSFRLVVLASGAGTNLQAILDQLHGREAGDGEPTIEVVGVGSNRPDANALERAQAVGVETAVFPASAHPDREARDAAIAAWAEGLGVDLIVLAGYMELLSPQFVARFENRIINVHPALLPSFPGLDAVSQALEHGVRVTGVTVHFVDEGIDSGPIILQQAVPVPADRESETLEQAIHATEHTLLPQAIRLIAAGRVRVEPGSRVVAIRD
ncbi:MAG TPA: phosphoribosylglycinamide formyltransferase [Solirubrobacterales bacterium]|nr:phosphoribosylglycinamide formyltransferase [Solirubrobacterales bacterium]